MSAALGLGLGRALGRPLTRGAAGPWARACGSLSGQFAEGTVTVLRDPTGPREVPERGVFYRNGFLHFATHFARTMVLVVYGLHTNCLACIIHYSPLTPGPWEVYLLGTAHVSQKSADDVRKLITLVQPDHVIGRSTSSKIRHPDPIRRLCGSAFVISPALC